MTRPENFDSCRARHGPDTDCSLAATIGRAGALLLWLALLPAFAQTTDQVAARTISFANQRFDPLGADLSRFGNAGVDAQGRGLRLLQWVDRIEQGDLQRARQHGLQILQYYPHNAYLVWADGDSLSRANSDPRVRWAGDFGPGLKQSAELRQRRGMIDLVDVHFLANGDPQPMLQHLAALGAQVHSHAPAQPDRRLHDAFVRVDASRLSALAEVPEVIWMGYQAPAGASEDEQSAQVVVGNIGLGGAPKTGYLHYLNQVGVSGAGVIWGISDEGVDLTHPEFVDRIASGFSFPGCLPGNGPGDDSPQGGHGTHVAGIVAGAGITGFLDNLGFLYGLGMAPEVRLFAQNVLCKGGTPTWPPTFGWQLISKSAIAAGALGSNASFTTGEGIRHGYQSTERTFDFMVRDGDFDTLGLAEGFAIVFSAGNAGPAASSLTAPKEAKNTIVVGATHSPRSGSFASLTGFSSRGPALDGRILPTVVAPGQAITSTRRLGGGSLCNQPPIPDSGELYAFCTGTSMAAPHVSGLAVLIAQWWRMEYGGADPSPAMLKAMLVAGAIDSPNVPAAVPNNDEGWGLARLPAAIRDGVDLWSLDQDALLDNNDQIVRYALGPGDPTQPVRVVLSWTDAPGAIGANPTLVNDLDLSVQRGATQYSSNPSGPGPAGESLMHDRLNNTEVISLPAGEQPFVLRVRAQQLPGDGVPLQGDETDQDFALLCSNCVVASGFDLSGGDEALAICSGDAAQFTLQLTLLDQAVASVSASIAAAPGSSQAVVSPQTRTEDGSFAVLLNDTVSLSAGNQSLDLDFSSDEFSLSKRLQLRVAETAPLPTTLLEPAVGEESSHWRPLLRWSEVDHAVSYHLQVSSNEDFSSPLIDTTLQATQFRPELDMAPEQSYYWRVSGNNACGSAPAVVGQFRTPAALGSCPAGTRMMPLYIEPMAPPEGDWSHSSAVGDDRWRLSTVRAQSPSYSWNALSVGAPSDQRLDSPPIVLPAASERPVLSFAHWRDIEARNADLCWDGAVVDLIPAEGAVQQAAIERFQSGGPQRIMAPTSLAAGRPAWCGVQDFETVHLDLRDVAGQSVRVRFRMLTDAVIGREGWYIDDLRVHSCVDEDILFRQGMGAEPH